MTTKTAPQVFEAIQRESKRHRADVRHVASMSPGECARQGDVYLTMLDRLPAQLGKKTEQRQLAPGTTQGSRHIVAASCGATIYEPAAGASALLGPVIDSPGRLLVEHPEHGHLDLPRGVYQATFQRDYAKERADEIRRVAD